MANPMMRWLKQSACASVMTAYHQVHTRRARKALRAIESEVGRLSAEVKNECDSYAREVLGWRGYAPWLYVYASVAGGFRYGWIPDNYYGHVVVSRVKGAYGAVSNRKALSWLLFSSEAFPDRGYRIGGINYGYKGERISDHALAAALFQEDEAVVFKTEGSSQGRSVLVVRAADFDDQFLANLGNGVFQSYVQQHPFFAEYTPSSVATIRLTTVIDDAGVPSVRACYLRFARGYDTHVRSASHLRVAVDPVSGRLDPQGYLPSWSAIERHPDSLVPFSGAIVPRYDACVESVVDLHRRMPFVGAIGWDVIVDDRGRVRIFEWNGEHNDIKFSEATQGPCFAGLGWENLWRTKAPSSSEWVTAARQGVC